MPKQITTPSWRGDFVFRMTERMLIRGGHE